MSRKKTKPTPRFSEDAFARALVNPHNYLHKEPGWAGRRLAQLLNTPMPAMSNDELFEAVGELVWRNTDEVIEAIYTWSLHMIFGACRRSGSEHSNRVMAAFILTAMMDGKGIGSATLRLIPKDMKYRPGKVVATYGPKLIRSADLETWQSLPETVTIYRGDADGGETRVINATQWTLDPRIAAHFAYGCSGVVYVAKVDRSQILHYSDARDEREVILFPTKGGTLSSIHLRDKDEIARIGDEVSERRKQDIVVRWAIAA